jgi:predicted hotdog family 3-hydroxylacyl-ACP dehydratase
MTGSPHAIAQLLPHAGRAILLDELEAETAQGVIAVAHIQRSHPFFSAELNGVPSWVGIELMAQAIALHAGLLGRRGNEAPRAGYLLGARSYVPTLAYFPAGARLEVRAECVYVDASGLGAYDCSIHIGQEQVVKSAITVFHTEKAPGG